MIKVTLKDGSVKEFPAGISAYEAAKEISTGPRTLRKSRRK